MWIVEVLELKSPDGAPSGIFHLVNGDAPWACIGRGPCEGGCDKCSDGDMLHESMSAEHVIEDAYLFWISATEVRFAFGGAKLWRDGFVIDGARERRALDAARRHRFW